MSVSAATASRLPLTIADRPRRMQRYARCRHANEPAIAIRPDERADAKPTTCDRHANNMPMPRCLQYCSHTANRATT